MINQSGRSVHDMPLLGETSKSRIYLLLSMILCSIVHFICLELASNALVDIIIYIFLCLIIAPLLFILFVAPTEKALTYYLTGEIGIKKESILFVIIASLVSFGLTFLLTMVACKEIINLYHNDILQVPIPVQVDRSPYMVLFYILFILVLPIVEESFWRIFLPKSFASNFESTLLISLGYGFMAFVVIYCLFGRWIYGLIGFIYSILIHIVFSYVHRHCKAFGIFLLSFAMHLGMAISLYLFLFSKLANAISSAPPTSPTASPTFNEINHDTHH